MAQKGKKRKDPLFEKFVVAFVYIFDAITLLFVLGTI